MADGGYRDFALVLRACNYLRYVHTHIAKKNARLLSLRFEVRDLIILSNQSMHREQHNVADSLDIKIMKLLKCIYIRKT